MGSPLRLVDRAEPSTYITVPEIARIIGRSETKTYQLLEAGLIPSERRGKVYAIKRADFEHWRATPTRRPEPAPPATLADAITQLQRLAPPGFRAEVTFRPEPAP